MSMYPIQETATLNYMSKAVIEPGGLPIAVYATHTPVSLVRNLSTARVRRWRAHPG